MYSMNQRIIHQRTAIVLLFLSIEWLIPFEIIDIRFNNTNAKKTIEIDFYWCLILENPPQKYTIFILRLCEIEYKSTQTIYYFSNR